MSGFLVSVVIPCFNVENYVEEAIHSAYSQADVDVEVIAVDNNSSDKTKEVLENLKRTKYPEILIMDELEPGACAARNKGLQVAKGDWVQFLDADDILDSKKIGHQLNLISQENSDDVCMVAGAHHQQFTSGERKHISVLSSQSMYALFVGRLGITSANLWNRTAVLGAKGWDVFLKSSQEADLMFRLLKNGGRVVCDNTPLTTIRKRESGNISDGSAENLNRYLHLRASILEYMKACQPSVYAERKENCFGYLYQVIKELARKDLNQADTWYQRMFSKGVSLRFTSQKEAFIYSLIPLFGFKTVYGLRLKIMSKKNSF